MAVENVLASTHILLPAVDKAESASLTVQRLLQDCTYAHQRALLSELQEAKDDVKAIEQKLRENKEALQDVLDPTNPVVEDEDGHLLWLRALGSIFIPAIFLAGFLCDVDEVKFELWCRMFTLRMYMYADYVGHSARRCLTEVASELALPESLVHKTCGHPYRLFCKSTIWLVDVCAGLPRIDALFTMFVFRLWFNSVPHFQRFLNLLDMGLTNHFPISCFDAGFFITAAEGVKGFEGTWRSHLNTGSFGAHGECPIPYVAQKIEDAIPRLKEIVRIFSSVAGEEPSRELSVVFLREMQALATDFSGYQITPALDYLIISHKQYFNQATGRDRLCFVIQLEEYNVFNQASSLPFVHDGFLFFSDFFWQNIIF